MQYLFYSFSIIFFSWFLGEYLNDRIKNKVWYSRLTHLKFIKKRSVFKLIGLDIYKWLLTHTFYKRFNPKLKLTGSGSDSELKRLRNEMTYAEISHFIAFFLVTIVTAYLFLRGNMEFGFILFILNLFLNLYPSLLQQKNKSRIDKLLGVKFRR